MAADTVHAQGMLDTNILILRAGIDQAELPDEVAISAITLAELSAGPLQVKPGDVAELAKRLDILQRAEAEFDPIPFTPEAARLYGRIAGAVVAAGRTPRRRVADLMIAATAMAEGLPLYTTNPGDFVGLEGLVAVVGVRRPPAL